MSNTGLLDDPMAVSVGTAVAVANRHITAEGINLEERSILVRQATAEDGTPLWRISYLPIPPPGMTMRGGDYIVEVNTKDASIYRTRLGQ
jgi:hypothetical protein